MPQTVPDAVTAVGGGLDEILARFDRYHPARIDLTLDRTRRLLAQLGDPQHDLAPVIHVAGTNGKGSTIALLRAMCEAAGLAVSTYTSPHLVSFTERFVLAGTEISMSALCDLLREVDAVNAGQPITEFEIVTAAAFLVLSRTPADVVLLETGLGGRYDATNVVDAPLATVITPVSLDHQAYLGPDIATIAAEKAAIQKRGVLSVVAPQPTEAARVIERIGAASGAVPFSAGAQWSFEPHADGFTYHAADSEISLPPPALVGAHQLVNAATAVACLAQCAHLAVSQNAMAAGLASVRWPGRLERLADGPLRRRLPPDWEVWVDAGHNGAGGAALATALRDINARAPLPLHIVFAMLEDKDPAAFIGPFAGMAASITAVPLQNEPRSHDAAASVAALARAGIAAAHAGSLTDALAALAATSSPTARVVICGSHSLVGAALRANRPAE